ncbi:MAG: zinc-regulated TonB-dependent outer membrane receptor [Pseudomonadota bacterium]
MFVAFTESCAARRRARRCFVSGALLLFAAEAGAQAAAAPRAPADEALGQGTEPAPPASDLTEIEAALAADAALGTATDERAANRGPSPSPPSMNPDLALIGSFAGAVFSEAENHQTGAHDPSRNGFELLGLELVFGAAVDPALRFDGTLVFGHSGVEIEEAYATTLALGARFAARFGRFASRFGRANALHPHAWHFVDQPLPFGRVFGGEGLRGVGVELSYLTALPWFVEVTVAVTEASGDETARSFLGDDERAPEGPEDLLTTLTLEQFFPLSADWSLAVGLSGAFGPNATGNGKRTEVYGADLYLKYRPTTVRNALELTLTSEWLYRRRQVPEDVLADASAYLELVLRVARRYGVGVRYELGSPSYGRSGDVVSDPLDPGWQRVRSRVAAAVSYAPSEYSRFRLQGSRDSAFGEPVWAAFLTAEVAIGAHRAHAF